MLEFTVWCLQRSSWFNYETVANGYSVIALSKLYDLKDPRLQNIQVKGDLIPNTDGRIMTRSRARQSKPTSFLPSQRTLFASDSRFFSLLQENVPWVPRNNSPIVPSFDSLFKSIDPFPATFARSIKQPQFQTKISTDPDQWTIVPATLKILKVLIVELQSASGTGLDTSAAADLAEEGSNDGDWEDEPNPFVDLGSGFSKEQLMAFAAEDGPGMGRQKDDETQAFLVDFFTRAATTQGFAEEFATLTEDEQRRLQESAT